ncbi:hypothetical protein [Nostoc sp.]|uniref:hypothetical protein n=1 Tax=Nostoc sp. TaxID=1180 RepID=UPI002FF44F74
MGEIRDNYTPQEQKNIELVKEYMQIAYDPKRASAEAVGHLCASNNKFIAPTTFPNVHTLEEYAQDHGEIMKQVNNLHFVSFDVLFAKEDKCVSGTRLRETIAASRMGILILLERRHSGQPLAHSG